MLYLIVIDPILEMCVSKYEFEKREYKVSGQHLYPNPKANLIKGQVPTYVNLHA